MKTLVLGGNGMLGHKVVQRFSAGSGETWWTLRGTVSDAALDAVPLLRSDGAIQRVDATRFDDLAKTIRELRPDVVVNCLGVIKQRAASLDEHICMTINAELPHRLARLLASWNARLIHVSTDCVFDGTRGNYTEEDSPTATDLYGRTKALGEVKAPNATTLRTSFIGRELRYHKSLLDWFLAQNGKRISGYRRAIWSGVTTAHLADVIEMIATRYPRLSGIYNVSSGRISKFDLLVQLREAYRLDLEIEPDDAFCRDLSLVGEKLESATGYVCESWNSQIEKLLADPTPYAALYELDAALPGD